MKKGKVRVLAGIMGTVLVWTEVLSVGIKASAAGEVPAVMTEAEAQEESTEGTVEYAAQEPENQASENSTEKEGTQEEVPDGEEIVGGETEGDSATQEGEEQEEEEIEKTEEETGQENTEIGEENSSAEKTGDLETGQETEETDSNMDGELKVRQEGWESMASADDIASGISNDIAWVIDANGKLTVEGTGDFKESSSEYMRAPWWSYCDSIKSATINVSGMTDASYMFYRCNKIINIDFSNFSTDKVTNMVCMFGMCSNLASLDLSNFDTSNVTDMNRMFWLCDNLKNLDLSSFNTSNVTNMASMFSRCSNLASLDLSNFDTSNVTNMNCMFWLCDNLKNLDLSSFNTSKVKNMGSMFSECNNLESVNLDSFNTDKVEDMSTMFYNCKNLYNLNVNSFNTSKVKDMGGMFSNCSNLKKLDVSNFDTQNVTHMGSWFVYTDLDPSEEVEVSGMFSGCSSLTELDVSNFDTSNVTTMWGMFYRCSNLKSLDVSNFDTSQVETMAWMFYGCNQLSYLDLSGWDTGNVTNVSDMFGECKSLTDLDLSNFNLEKADTRPPEGYWDLYDSDMFADCINLSTIYTPYNLQYPIPLPTQSASDTWCRSDGTTVTELPQNLTYSVALGRNHIPKEKDSADQLTNSGNSLFLFRDAMTGVPIKGDRVCIEEKFTGTHYYYPSKDTGYISFPLSKNCKEVFISTYFDGYEHFGGWAQLSYYQSESGIYTFDIKPKQDKYICRLPSMKTSVTTSAPDVETEDGNVGLFNINMGFDMDFGKGVSSTVTYDKDTKTVKVAVSTEGKASYDAIKEAYKTSGSKSGHTLDEQFKNVDESMKPGKFCNVSVKMAVSGYLEFSDTGKFMEGGVIVVATGSGAVEYRPVCAAGLAYAKLELSMTLGGNLVFTYVEGNLDVSAVIICAPTAKIVVGVGWNLAHTEIGAIGKFPVSITIPYVDDKESLSINASFSLYGEVKFFCFGGKRTTTVEGNIWPAMSFSDYADSKSVSLEPSVDDLEILPRNYLSAEKQGGIAAYSRQNESVLTPSDSFRYSEISEDQGVFPENNVQYVKLSDGTEILAWIHDFGDKSSANRTTLVYSVNKNDGNGWGSLASVCSDTKTGDYYPHMTAEGNKAYLVWNKAAMEFSEDTTVDTVSSNMDIYAAVFENGSFSEPQRISESGNGLMEFSPIVAADGNMASVAWLVNSENDYHYTKGSNAIWVCEYKGGVWGSPVCYASGLHYVSDYDMDYVGGSPAVLYAEDADNVSATQDGTVYYIRNGKKAMAGDASYRAEIVDLCDGTLYFSGGNRVYKASADKLSYIYDTGIATDNFTVVKNASGEEVILFLKQDGFAGSVCASYFRNGLYTSPVPIVENGSRITNYSPVYYDDQTISIAYDEEEILDDPNLIYGLADMVVTRNVQPESFFVAPSLAYRASDAAEGNIVEFTASASNFTAHEVSKVKVSLTGNSLGDLHTEIMEVNIPVGESQNISLSYLLPEPMINQQYTLTVIPVDAEDKELSDNSAVCELGFSDIVLTDLKLEGNKISGTVKNIGCQTAENVSLTMKEDNQENTPFAVLSYGGNSLAAGESWRFSQEIEPAVFENVGEVKYYLLSAETDSQENSYSNNSSTLYSEPVAPDEILFDQTELVMQEKTAGTIHAKILPENATFQNAVYTSGDNRIALVDEKGTVYAVGKGKTVITAYTPDGSLSTACEITVEGQAEIPYTLSEQKLELEVGTESALCVKAADGTDAEGVIWASTNEEVVTVDANGAVLAKGEGIAYLTASVDTFTDVCIVRVSDHSILQLACAESSLQLTVGETARLEMEVIPKDTTMEKTLTYTSEDTSVVTVDGQGTVTAVAEGSTMVTVSSVNGVQNRIPVTVSAPVTYTVIFDTMGGTRVDPIEVKADKVTTEEGDDYIGYVASIPDTYKEGYLFCGWYPDKNGTGETLKTDTPVTEDEIYYAKWQPGGFDDDYEGVLPEDIPEGGIPSGLWIAGIDAQGYPYTGKAIKPTVRVYDGSTRLKAGTDYTLSYKNNTKANDASDAKKAPTITVKGKGNYGGKETAAFKILPIDLNDSRVITEDIITAYNKKVQKKVPGLTYNGKKLAKNKDFIVSYPALERGDKDALKTIGTYDIVLTAKPGGNFTGTRTVKLTITDSILLNKVSVKKIPSQAYTGNAIEPELTLTYKKTPLVKGTDYTVSYADNISAGTATVILTGTGKYAGTKKVTFKINGISLKKAEILGLQDRMYDGSPQEPMLTVSADHMTLEKGKDYEVSYSNHINAGKASVTITGKGKYTGTVKKTFRIEAHPVLEDMGLQGGITAKYVKGGSRPKVELTFAGKKLKEGTDYTISYRNNKSVTSPETKNKPSLIITGKGNFKGKLTKYFTIVNKALDDPELPVTIMAADKAFTDKAGNYKSTPILTDADGKKLTAGKDYEKEILYTLDDGTVLTAKDKLETGTNVKVKVMGKGTYYGVVRQIRCTSPMQISRV